MTQPKSDVHQAELSDGTKYWRIRPQSPALPILMLHGHGGDHRGLESIARKLKNHPIFLFDTPGFGQSAQIESTGIAGDVDRMLKWCDELSLSEFILIGHSMGSVMSVHLASHYPDRARKMILLSPVPSFSLIGKILCRGCYYTLKVLPRSWRKVVRSSFFHKVVYRLFQTHRSKSDRQRYVNYQLSVDYSPETWSDVARSTFFYKQTCDWPLIKLPCLIIYGKKDKLVTLSSIEHLATTLPEASLAVFDDVGHFLHREATDKAADAINNFLES